MSVQFSIIRNTVPRTPGVYFFLGDKERILYIGKAANLHARLSSYFLKNAAHDAAKRRMITEARTIRWEEKETEIDALISEAFLIKKHLPPYNVVMRDDKQYLFVGFTNEPFPHIILTHQPIQFQISDSSAEDRSAAGGKFQISKRANVKTEFFGPFTDAGAIRRLLHSLRKVIPHCTCKKPHARRCQATELGLCFGFCCVKNMASSSEERSRYKKNIRFLKNVLQGKQQELLRHLKAEMNRASKRTDFESAKTLRDQIYALEHIFAHKHILKKELVAQNQKGLHELKRLLRLSSYPERIEGYDISNIQGTHAVGSMVVFTDGTSEKNAYRKFRIRTVRGANDTAMLREVLTRRLAHTDWPLPDVMLIDGGRGQLNAALQALSPNNLKNAPLTSRAHGRPCVVSIAKREEELYTPESQTPFKLKEMPAALLYLIQQIRNEAHRFAISYYRKRHHATVVPNF